MRTNHQITAFQKPIFLHDSSVAVVPSSLSGAYNTAYTAHFVRPNFGYAETSYMPDYVKYELMEEQFLIPVQNCQANFVPSQNLPKKRR